MKTKQQIKFLNTKLKQAHVLLYHMSKYVSKKDMEKIRHKYIGNIPVPYVEVNNDFIAMFGKLDDKTNWADLEDVKF